MNEIKLAGEIVGNIEYSHEVLDDKFYKFSLATRRNSGYIDVLNCIIPQSKVSKLQKETKVQLVGEVQTRNVTDEAGIRHLEVFIFVHDVLDYIEDMNNVKITAFVCKPTNHRETPRGRIITDIMLASNRKNKRKSDYIPSISWGKNAVKAKDYSVGVQIEAVGRLQSRDYFKKLENGAEEMRVAYELSIADIDEVI